MVALFVVGGAEPPLLLLPSQSKPGSMSEAKETRRAARFHTQQRALTHDDASSLWRRLRLERAKAANCLRARLQKFYTPPGR